MSLLLTMLDEGIDIPQRDLIGWLVDPGEDQLQIVGVVDGGAGVRTLAPQPLGELLDFD